MGNHSLAALTILSSLFAVVGCKEKQERQGQTIVSSTSPTAAVSAQAPKTEIGARASEEGLDSRTAAIRGVDLKKFIATHLGEFNSDLSDLQTDCGEGQERLQSLAPPIYRDLDNDGQEEAVVEGWSCLAGNGGADFGGVLKLRSNGELTVLPVEPLPKTFKGKNTFDGLRGHMVITISDGKLEERFGIYTEADLNCCPEGGERRFIYRWDGHKFALDDIIDVPSEKSGS